MAENEQEPQSDELQEEQEISITETNDITAEFDVQAETETTEVANDEEESAEVENTEETEAEPVEESAIEQGNEDVDGDAKDGEEDDDDEDEELEEEKNRITDPNVMPQVNVAILAKRKWQVKVYPLKPADFGSGMIARVFKAARESLLYLMTGKCSLGKGEMYIANVTESIKVVRSLQTMDSHFPEINIEIVRKNGEGVVQEKASMRFDTKMVRMLFVEAGGSRYGGPFRGRNRKERVIGSVFVKNLPPGTTKNMLRVMFPFAQEINYNPEKYTDGTARIVMKTRSTVITCLKAFAKIELQGNILELHPLEKKQRAPRPKSSKERDSSKVDESGDKSDSENKTNEDGDTTEIKSDDKTEEKDSTNKESPVKKDGDSKTPSNKDKDKNSQQKRPPRRRNRPDRKPLPSSDRRNNDFGDRRRAGASGGMRSLMDSGLRNNRGFSAGRNRGFAEKRMSGGSDLGAKAEATKDMMVLQGQLNMAIKSQLAMLNQTQMAVEQAKRGAAGLGLGSSSLGFAGTSGVLGRSGLSQLSEQKRGQIADSFSAGGNRSRERGNLNNSGSWGTKRSAAQADLFDDYDTTVGYGRKQGRAAQRSGQNKGAQNRAAQNRAAQNRAAQNRAAQGRAGQGRSAQSLMSAGYDNDVYRQETFNLQDRMDEAYGYGASDRSYSAGLGLGASGRSTNYSDTSYGYRY